MKTLDQSVAFMTIDELSDSIRSRQISPVELTALLLERIDKLNPQLNAFLTVTGELAMAEAKVAEAEIMAGRYKGPLHGIPIAHKDIYYTKDIPTTASSKVLDGYLPDYDATTVRKLREAGTVMLGKVQTHEFAAGAMTNSPYFGPCRNPWNTDLVPGGSSGGSGSAVAAGLTFLGTGSDTGGSIRIPAACCGIVGMKPTYGRVSRYGIYPLSWSLDHAGPLTRSVKDAALCLEAMAGSDPHDDSTVDLPVPHYAAMLRSDLKGVKLGIPAEYFFDNVDPEIEKAVRAAIAAMEELGAEVKQVSIPSARLISTVAMGIVSAEVAAIHAANYKKDPDAYGPDVRATIESGMLMPAVHYLQAQRARKLIQRDFLAALEEVDALVSPTTPITPPGVEQHELGMRLAELTMPTDVTGLPTLALPCGFSAAGMPISLQIMGRPFEEGGVLGIGYAYEQYTTWHTRHPQL